MRHKLQRTPLLLKALIWFVPLPFIACNAGWIMTEVGRQPWLVYNLMKTSEGVTEGLRTSQVAFSLTMLTILLTLVTVIAVLLMINHCRKGPAAIEE